VPLSPNTLGQMYALTVLTPIAPGAEPALRGYLEELGEGESPLARLPRTHFGRWVIMQRLVTGRGQRRHEDLGGPFLIFSSTFDGDLDSYLTELTTELGDEAEHIWGACIGAPQPARGPALKDYLLHNQIDTGLFFCPYPDATVRRVRDSVRARDRAIAFAVRAQAMDPKERQRAFLEEF
jgi:hypothetical protein